MKAKPRRKPIKIGGPGCPCCRGRRHRVGLDDETARKIREGFEQAFRNKNKPIEWSDYSI